MTNMKIAYALALFLLTPAGSAPGGNSNQMAREGYVTNQSNNVAVDHDLAAEITRIAAVAKGRVGVNAVILETGRSVSLIPDEHFPMQSVYKFPISMAILAQVDAGKLKLDQKVLVEKTDLLPADVYSPIRDQYPNGTEMTIEQLVESAIEDSDGTASDVLMRTVGGAPPIQKFLQGMGIDGITIGNTEKELNTDWYAQYRNWATPRAATNLLRALQEQKGLSSGSRALLVKFMTESKPGANRLKGLLPLGTVVVHKTGTGGSRSGITSATNDIGIITLPNGNHLLIAVFVSDSPADLATREGVIAKIAHAVWDKWTKS